MPQVTFDDPHANNVNILRGSCCRINNIIGHLATCCVSVRWRWCNIVTDCSSGARRLDLSSASRHAVCSRWNVGCMYSTAVHIKCLCYCLSTFGLNDQMFKLHYYAAQILTYTGKPTS